MNKVFKVIWNEARNAYVVVSEIAKNRGSKSCSTKKLLAMLIATGVMTCASFDVLAAQPTAAETARYQYVAFGDKTAGWSDGQEKTIDGHKYIYDATNKYWVREGYKLTVEENGKLHTPLSAHGKAADVAYIGGGDTGSILQSVTSMVSASGTVTNMGESLSRITASAFTGVSHSGGTAVAGDWDYIIQDSSWKDSDSVASGNYKDGYVDLIGPQGGMPKGFVTVGDKLKWDDTKQAYTYNGKPVDYSNVYVIDGKIGVFTNQSGSDFYKGTVFGKNNEILMTVKDGDHFYSYWAAEVTDPSATMQSYRLAEYKKDLAVLVENDNKLHRDDIKEVTMTTDAGTNSAIIGLVRNGNTEAGAPVKGAITVTSGGGAGGKDTFVKISNGTANQTFATGSKVEAIGTTEATTGIKINGQEYTIKSGSVVSVAKDASNKTTTITVDGKATTITDTDTTYTAGDGIEINGGNAISVSKNLTGMQSIKGAGAGSISFADGGIKLNNKVTIDNTGKITGVADGTDDTDAVNVGQLNAVKAEASKKTTLSNGKNTTVTSVTTDGQTDYKVNVAGDLKDITSVANGASEIKLNADSIIIANTNKTFAITNSGIGMSYVASDYSTKAIMLGENGTTISGGLDVAGSKITGVAAGEANTDAVNVGQLNTVKNELQTSDKQLVTNPASTDGSYKPDANGNISLRVEDQNKNGYNVVIKDVASKAELSEVANRVTNVENKVTQIETDVTNIKNDITNIQTDVTDIKTDITNINNRVDKVEALAGKHTTLENGTNINVEETLVDGHKNYKVNLNKDITLGDENGNKVSISGTNGTITATGDITTANRINADKGGKLADIDVTGNKLSNGSSSITLDGTNVKVNDKVTVDKDGKISGVAKGDISNTSTDAVNGSQLYDTNTHITNVENQVISNSNRIGQLSSRVNKVGAGAAALAALHPMDFDPDDKLTFSAGYGNYAGENAAAIGAYYRPDEKVMFSVAGTVGNGENMVNAGVSFALDRTNHVSNSRTALAREVIDLRGQLAVMGAKMAKMEKAFGMLDETKTKLFPDVPANHWAYEYIAKLAGNGYIEGYPDGNFGGDRLMTRYEFAAMLYRAIENGAALEEKIIKEFEPELGRIRVDRISGEDGDRDKIERVRVNDTKGERDHYGNKLAK